MEASAVLGISLTTISAILLSWSLVADPDRIRRDAIKNLSRDLRDTSVTLPQLESRPGALGGFRGLANALTPAGAMKRLDRSLAQAGRPAAWPLTRVVVVKLILGVMGVILGVFIFITSPSILRLLLGAAGTAFLYYFLDLLIYNAGNKRSQQVQLELADTLDQMVIAVEAGLGFEGAMAHASRNGTGPLAEELTRTLQDIQVGQPRKAAYEALAARNDVQDLRRFITAIVQADAYGIAIGDVLRTQASEMRIKRRQRAEEKAMQVPVKIVVPLILCILPVLFIVILGPAVLSIIDLFQNM